MLRLAGSPITISGSALDDDFRNLVEAISPWLTPQQKDWAFRRSSRLKYVNDERTQAKQFEESVRALLQAHIFRTEIGKAMLRVLPRHIPIWIVRYDSWLQKRRACNAFTGQMSSRLSDGVRITYLPESWAYNRCGETPGYRADEVLFHEMVHAVRFARFGFEGTNHEPLRMNKDHEEFLAVQMTNVYRSEKKAKLFNHAYMTSALGTQTEVERTLASMDFVTALESFSDDPFVAAVAAINTPFNPFRDLKRLKDQALLNQQPRPNQPPRPQVQQRR